jgi:hypothetical protein
MIKFFSELFRRIINFIRPNHIDTKFLEEVKDDIVIDTLKKWEEELEVETPNVEKLIAYADDIHIRLLELNISPYKVNNIYDRMFRKINKLHNETHSSI